MGPRPFVWALFLAGMFVSAMLALWFGRSVTFTGDELSILSLVADLNPGEMFEPYVGHLVPVPFLAYKVMLETVGTGNYYFFQMMGLAAIFLMGAGVLYWGTRRVPDLVALAPTLVLVLFTGDLLHYVAGNGFTIVFALACGVWALNAWDRDTWWGDLAALVLLSIGMLTYTVGVAFAVGLVVAALAGNRRRLWVAGIPLLAYVLWRLLVASTSTEIEDAGPDWVNVLLLPAWAFQGIGGVLETMLGVGFDFDGSAGAGQSIGTVAPALAIGFFAAIVYRLRSGGIPRTFWTVAAIALALFTSQVLVWGSFEARAEPVEPRYLYPGALVMILMGLELARGIEWDRLKQGLLWFVAAVAIVSAVGSLVNSVKGIETATSMARAQATAAYILETVPNPPPEKSQPRTSIRKSFDPVATAGLPSLSFSEEELEGVDPKYSESVDLFLADSLDIVLEPVEEGAPTGRCRPALADGGKGVALLPEGPVILESTRNLSLSLGRFGKPASWKLGELPAGVPTRLPIPPDGATTSWFVQTNSGSAGTLADLSICRSPTG